MAQNLVITGAREHNLKNLNVTIPRDRLVVITGLSGSGKSSLAFDTIYAEGQRRYVESLSAYARQFLEQMDKPDVDSIEGLSPAISIEQKTAYEMRISDWSSDVCSSDLRGMSTSMFLRLWTRAPRTAIQSCAIEPRKRAREPDHGSTTAWPVDVDRKSTRLNSSH